MVEMIFAFILFWVGNYLGQQIGYSVEKSKIIKEQKVCASTTDAGVSFEKCWTLKEERPQL